MVGRAEVLRRTALLRSEHRVHGGQSHAVEVAEHLLHRPLGVGERPVRAQRIEGVPRRPVHRDHAGLGHRHALAFEELPAQRIRRRRAIERDVDVDRMSRRCGIELGQRRQPVLGELPRLQAADGGDECALRHTLRALANHVLHLGDRERGLDRPRLVARPAANELHVKVVVDHPGDDRAAAQVDGVGAAARRAGRVAHFDEPAVGDAHLRHDGALRVHGVDLPVGQQQETSARTRLGEHDGRQQHERCCRRDLKDSCYHRLSIGLAGSAVMFRVAQW